MNKSFLKTIHETFINTVDICGKACECINILVPSKMMSDKNMAIVPKDPLVGIQYNTIIHKHGTLDRLVNVTDSGICVTSMKVIFHHTSQ